MQLQLNFEFYLGTQEEAAEAYDIAAIKFRGTSAVTNFDISRYDVKRICSSSTLIAGDLAKRAPPIGLDDYNSCASSASPRPLLQITNGEASSDELAEMMWNGTSDDNMQLGREQAGGGTHSPHLSPAPMDQVVGDGGGFSQGYFSSLEGQKYGDDGM